MAERLLRNHRPRAFRRLEDRYSYVLSNSTMPHRMMTSSIVPLARHDERNPARGQSPPEAQAIGGAVTPGSVVPISAPQGLPK